MNVKTVAALVLKKVLPAAVGLVVLILVIAWLAGAFTKKIPPGPAAAAGDDLGTIRDHGSYVVQEIKKPYVEEAIGTLKAASRTEISSRVLATIERITVRADDAVAEGDVLIELDRKAFEAQLSQAQAELDAVTAAVQQAEDVYNRAARLRQTNPGTALQTLGVSPSRISTR